MTPGFLTLTTFDAANPEGYDDEPEFAKHLWPLMVNSSSSFTRVVEWLDHIKDKTGGARDHGPMAALGAPILESLEYRSFFGGHLSVSYETADKELLRRLIKLYRLEPRQSEALSELELSAAVVEMLETSIVAGNYMVMFGHDADPVYILGDTTALFALVS